MFLFIELSCPPNSEYHLCSSHMSDCAENSSFAAVKCKEGCFCKSGFFHSAGQCVPNSECGCIYDGVYHEIHENFYPDEHCLLHCACVDHNRVKCTNHTCPPETTCAIRDGLRACHASEPVKCTVMSGRHFRSYDGDHFDFNMGSCRYLLSQTCDEEESGPAVVVQQGQLYLRVHGVNVSLEREYLGKVKVSSFTFTHTFFASSPCNGNCTNLLGQHQTENIHPVTAHLFLYLKCLCVFAHLYIALSQEYIVLT